MKTSSLRDEDISINDVFLELGVRSLLVTCDDEFEAFLLCPIFQTECVLGGAQ